MNYKLTRTLFVACAAIATFCLLNPVHAEQPKMNKAIELLQGAKTAKNPAVELEKAKKHVESTEPGGRDGRRFTAINKIDKAIAAVNKGKDAGALIDEAIVALQEGVEIKKETKGKKKN